jgi:hypothetical protein
VAIGTCCRCVFASPRAEDTHTTLSTSPCRCLGSERLKPATHGEITGLVTAKNGLELVECMVYADGDACEKPHGLDSCVVLGFRHLPRYTGAIIFQELVVVLPRMGPPDIRRFLSKVEVADGMIKAVKRPQKL